MRKVKITKTPHVGDQMDFALVDNKGKLAEGISTSAETNVNQTLGAIPREEANIEAEHGETVLGDINGDGFLEHFKFTGKTHKEGGIPQNVTPGSFIFSNTKSLKIKDPNVLEFFGLKEKKGGFTPGEIAKRYDINTYMNNLKSEDSDYITKNTAQEMLKTNTEKLAMLALIQESMKGFPNGIPDFAQSAVSYLNGEQQEMKFGGEVLPKFKDGGNITLTPDQVIYVNGRKYKYQSHKDPGFFYYNDVTFVNQEASDARHPKTITVSENNINKYLKSNEVIHINQGTDKEVKVRFGTSVDKAVDPYTQSNTIGGNTFSNGEEFYMDGKKYRIVDAHGKEKVSAHTSGNPYDMGTSAKNETYFDDALKVVPIDEKGKAGAPTIINSKQILNSKRNNTYEKVTSSTSTQTPEQQRTGDGWGTTSTEETTPKVVHQGKSGSGTVPTAKPIQGGYSGPGGPKVITPKSGTPEEQALYSQYGSEAIQGILAKSQNVKYSGIKFGQFGKQSILGNTGIYLSSNNAASHKLGDLSPEEWKDFQDRHGDWIDKEYVSANGQGFEAFQKDLRTGKVTGDQASGWFQEKVNEKTQKEFGIDYFGKNDASNPYTVDRKFGQVTYSVPRFFDLPKPAEVPVDKPEDVEEPPVIDKQEPLAPDARKGPGTWWLPDITNFVGTLTDKINRYEPLLTKITPQTPGYVTKDPTRTLAANQEQMTRFQNQIFNTLDPNVAAATMLGASGEGFVNAANTIGNIENENVGIVNQAYPNNAQIENTANQFNAAALQKFVAENATLNQNIDNAQNMRKWRQIGMFNQGTDNWFKKKQMEQVLFPQVFIDPITGDASFSGKGRDVFSPDTYTNPMFGGATNNPQTLMGNSMGLYDQAYQTHLQKYGNPELAHKFAQEQSNMIARKYSQAYTNPNAYPNTYEFGGIVTIEEFINNKE